MRTEAYAKKIKVSYTAGNDKEQNSVGLATGATKPRKERECVDRNRRQCVGENSWRFQYGGKQDEMGRS